MSTRYSKRFSRYVQPRPGLESAALALPLDIGAVPSLESLMEELTFEVSPGLEGIGDWIKDKLSKVSDYFSDLMDDVSAALRKWKANDWTSLSSEDQLRIVKKAGALFYAYNPEFIPKMDELIAATEQLVTVLTNNKLKPKLRSEVDGLGQKMIDAYGQIIKVVTGEDPKFTSSAFASAENLNTLNKVKQLSKQYAEALKSYKPSEDKTLDPVVVTKLVDSIQKHLPKLKKLEQSLALYRNSSWAFAESETEQAVVVVIGLALATTSIIVAVLIGPWAGAVVALATLMMHVGFKAVQGKLAGVESLSDSVLLDLHTGELSVGNESFTDWTKDKFNKIKGSITDAVDELRLLYRQFKAKDWNDLSEADQVKIINKSELRFFYYNPKKLPVFEKYVNAMAAFGELKRGDEAALNQAVANGAKAIDDMLVAMGESKGPEVPTGDIVKMLSNARILTKKLKAWKPTDGAIGDPKVVPKLLELINSKMIPAATKIEKTTEKQAGIEDAGLLVLFVGPMLVAVAIWAFWIWVVVSLIRYLIKQSSVGNESFEDSDAVTLAADAAAVSDTDLQPGVEAEGDDESSDEKADDAKVDESDADDKADESEEDDKADESEEDKSESEDTPATDETEGGDDVTAADAGDDSDAAEGAADTDEETTPVEIVDEITTTTEVDLDSDYVKEIEAVNAVETETDEVESDTEELEEISSGLESLIDAMYETQLAGGMSNLQYRTTMQHGVHNYARRAGVTVRTPGVESLGDSVRGRMYLSKVGIESAEGVASDVIEMLKNAWEQFRTMIADFFKRLFDHQSQLKEKLARIKSNLGTKRTGSVKIELPSGAASSLQYDGAVGPESVKKLAADCDALTRYLKSTNQLAKMLTTEVKVDNIEDGEYTEELNSKAQESLMLPLKELKMAGVEVVETDSADGAVKVEKAETLEATEVSSVDVAAVEQAVNAYNTLIDTWKADSRYLSISDKSTKGIWNLDSMKSLAGDALKRIKAYYRLFRAYLSGLGRRIAAARKGADAAVLYLELSSKAALQLPNKATA